MISKPEMDSCLLSSPDAKLMNSLSSEWYQNVLQDSFELQMKMAVQMEHRIKGSSSTDSFHSLPPIESEACFSPMFVPSASLSEISGELPESTRSSRGRRYKSNNLLAQFCSQVLQQTANPRLHQISSIVNQLKAHEVGTTEKKLKSQVREWFRKRREYLAAKIYRSCDRLLPKMNESVHDQHGFIQEICKNTTIVGLIAVEARLPMESDEEKQAFVKEKIRDYYLTYPKRRLRNSLGIQTNRDQYDDDFVLAGLMQ